MNYVKGLTIVLSALIFTNNIVAQESKQPTLILWQPNRQCKTLNIPAGEKPPVCDVVVIDGFRVGSIEYKGIYLAVAFLGQDGRIVADTYIANNTGDRMLVDPRNWRIGHYRDNDTANPKSLINQSAIPPQKIADSIQKRVRWANALAAFGAGMARSTTTSDVNGTVYSNGSTGTYTGQVTTTTPDYAAQRRATIQNEQRSRDAEGKSDSILSTALLPNTVFDKQDISGLVYFKREKKAKYSKVCIILNEIGFFFE